MAKITGYGTPHRCKFVTQAPPQMQISNFGTPPRGVPKDPKKFFGTPPLRGVPTKKIFLAPPKSRYFHGISVFIVFSDSSHRDASVDSRFLLHFQTVRNMGMFWARSQLKNKNVKKIFLHVKNRQIFSRFLYCKKKFQKNVVWSPLTKEGFSTKKNF